MKGETIQIFNYGNCRRDFTYVDDIVEGVVRVLQGAPERKKGEDGLPIPPYAVYNIGGGQPENLLDFVNILQEELVRAGVLPADFDFEAHKQLVPMQPGDVPTTYADAISKPRIFGLRFCPYLCAVFQILSRMTYMTIEQFRQIHEDWKQSGLSVQQYCENTGLTESRFYYWKSKLKAESLPSACGSFIPVKMSGKSTVYSARNTSGKALCEIEYPNGVVVRVTSDMTLDQLRQMVTLLR